MGRKRRHDRHLPERVYYRHGAYYFVDQTGKWHSLGRDYAEALRRLAAMLSTDAPVATIDQLIARYELEELPKKAPKTQAGRRQEFKPIRAVFGHMRPQDIEPHHVWTYFRRRGECEQARHEIRALSALLTYARRIGALTGPNPCFGLRLPGGSRRSRYVTDDEFLLARELAPPMVGYAMDLALLCGMDQSTILRLERRHLTDEGIQFERGKTGRLQLIEWNEELRLVVQALLREPPQVRRFLIATRKGQPYTSSGFQTLWQRLMRRALQAGLAERFTFHDLRAKSASDEQDDQTAADRLGHGDVRLTRAVYRRLPRRAPALRILDRSS